jgi:hypothetical protein
MKRANIILTVLYSVVLFICVSLISYFSYWAINNINFQREQSQPTSSDVAIPSGDNRLNGWGWGLSSSTGQLEYGWGMGSMNILP